MLAAPETPVAPLRTVGRRRWLPQGDWLPLTILVAAVLLVYLRFLDADFVGTDTLPAVQSNRVHAWSDLLGFWTRPLMAGTDFAVSQALFYRPVASLSFALDYALWGPNPVGYHLTNTLLQVAAAVLAYAVLRTLGLSRAAAFLGAALLAFHPTMATAVPVIARRYDSLSAALLFGSLAVLCRASSRGSRMVEIAALLLFGASLLAKESAFAALPLLPLLLFAAWSMRGDPRRSVPRAYARTLWPYLALAVGVFAGRYAVLGALGGHQGIDILSLNFEEYRVLLDRYVFFVFWPFRNLYPERTVGWAVLLVVLTAILGTAAWLSSPATRLLVLVGLVWAAFFGAFFILLRHIAGPWYMYYPLLGLGVAVGATADAVWQRLGRRETLGALSLGAAALVYTLGSLSTSPLVRSYDQWHQAGAVMRDYLAGIQTCTEDLPDDTAVTLWNAPKVYDDGSDESYLLLASMIEGFTYDAYMRLIRPGQHFNLFIGQPVTYTSRPADLEISCGSGGPNRRRVIATSASLPPPAFPTD